MSNGASYVFIIKIDIFHHIVLVESRRFDTDSLLSEIRVPFTPFQKRICVFSLAKIYMIFSFSVSQTYTILKFSNIHFFPYDISADQFVFFVCLRLFLIDFKLQYNIILNESRKRIFKIRSIVFL